MKKEIYPFDKVLKFINYCKGRNIKFYDFGFGSPKGAPPQRILDKCCRAIIQHKNRGYPTTIGESYIREKIASYMEKRFNIELNPSNQISIINGVKGGVFRFSLAVLNPEDYVLIPTPGYPIYATAAEKAYAKIYFLPLKKENFFLPDYENVPEHVLKKTKLMWINFPNNPTGAEVSKGYLRKLVEFCKKHRIILAADEVYIDLYSKNKPHSLLEISRNNTVSFFSLSKSHNMPNYRVGWIAGDKRLIQTFQKEENWIESGVPTFIQEALVEALNNTKYVENLRKEYIKKNKILSEAFHFIGLEKPLYNGCFYIWQKVPKGQTGEEFYKKLLKLNIISIPGAWLAHNAKEENVGKNYVRFALISSLEDTLNAAEIIKNNRKLLL